MWLHQLSRLHTGLIRNGGHSGARGEGAQGGDEEVGEQHGGGGGAASSCCLPLLPLLPMDLLGEAERGDCVLLTMAV